MYSKGIELALDHKLSESSGQAATVVPKHVRLGSEARGPMLNPKP